MAARAGVSSLTPMRHRCTSCLLSWQVLDYSRIKIASPDQFDFLPTIPIKFDRECVLAGATVGMADHLPGNNENLIGIHVDICESDPASRTYWIRGSFRQFVAFGDQAGILPAFRFVRAVAPVPVVCHLKFSDEEIPENGTIPTRGSGSPIGWAGCLSRMIGAGYGTPPSGGGPGLRPSALSGLMRGFSNAGSLSPPGRGAVNFFPCPHRRRGSDCPINISVTRCASGDCRGGVLTFV